ncbi:uncharacterized protein GGS25DRAFT_471810 [Hypoxylon fragiforme]|uniref:uncharacterized protein n=1 Tax=Hypoxylon fragiforme TaxID=63214 RepID=UPI0020C5EA65|nr:uncharacterized protein GGS25DRAFT_471810 [Hypoxylon fragiforme]KAI2614457.1 hypothetical protein GGS25DRAFT_471810 [Hypoxylon fragiforme]
MAAPEQQLATRPQQLVFVDGVFSDLAQEMADYLHISDDVKPLIEQDQKDEVLKKIILASVALHSVPEKEFTAAYNLLIHLVLQSDNISMFLPRVCDNLMKPVGSSLLNGPSLSLNVLGNIFNLLEPENPLRYNVFMTILRFIKENGMLDTITNYLSSLPEWFKDWDTNEEDQRKLYLEVADVADEYLREDLSFQYILKALNTFDDEEVKSEEAAKLALRALKIALESLNHLDFQDLLAVPAIQVLSDTHPVYFELLTIFAEKDLEDYNDFNDEHEGFIEKEHLNGEVLLRKIRLLTFASLAASAPSREIPYEQIAKALQIPIEEVEWWVIDVVRANLVEGKFAQKKKIFNLHQTRYRVFGEKQWREVGDRLDGWKILLQNVIGTLRRGQADVEALKKREQEDIERRLANAGIGGNSSGFGGFGGGGRRGGGGAGGGDRSERAPRKERTDDDD